MPHRPTHDADRREIRVIHPIQNTTGLLLFAVLALGSVAAAEPPSARLDVPKLRASSQLVLPALDVPALLEEDEQTEAAGEPARFALPAEVHVTPALAGEWERLDGRRSLWRLRVRSPGATDLNFGFLRFHLPPGASLHVVSELTGRAAGPYTAGDNKAHGQLWTPPVAGDTATLELLVPAGARDDVALELGRVGVGYRDVTGALGLAEPKNHDACNNDVACPVGDPWREQIRSVATYSFGGGFVCTGSLLADVPGSLRPWFLTAWHCMRPGDAPSMVVFWNFEASTCDGPDDGPVDQNQTGATFRATWRDSDFMLVELDDMPDPAHRVFYSGWDASDDPASGAVGIHHPRTHSKSISFENDPLDPIDDCVGLGGVDTHWRVNDWDDGTTEDGSSGSGIWEPITKRLIGTLSGGGAACGNDLSDCYGRFGVHWTGGGTDDTRLSNWLDPDGVGTLFVEGVDPNAAVRVALDSFAGADSCSLGAGDANGLWEPGEEIEIAVDLEVTGGSAAGVTGTLSTTTPGVTILDDTAEWADFPAPDVQRSLAPHFRIRLEDSLACFDVADLVVTVTSDDFEPSELSFAQAIGEPTAPDVPQPISSASPVASTLSVSDETALASVAVHVMVEHSWVGDLEIALRSPSGTVVTLLDRPGWPAGANGCADDDLDVTFDDASAMELEGHCAGTTPWFAGRAQPVELLDTLAGESARGTWTLEIVDHEDGDTGVLLDWELLTTPALSGGACTRCELVPCDGVALDAEPLRAAKSASGEIVIEHSPVISGCAEGVRIFRSASARPGSGDGLFPDDPAFSDASAEDLDPAPNAFRHVPPPGPSFYLAVEALPDGGHGPSGHYGN